MKGISKEIKEDANKRIQTSFYVNFDQNLQITEEEEEEQGELERDLNKKNSRKRPGFEVLKKQEKNEDFKKQEKSLKKPENNEEKSLKKPENNKGLKKAENNEDLKKPEKNEEKSLKKPENNEGKSLKKQEKPQKKLKNAKNSENAKNLVKNQEIQKKILIEEEIPLKNPIAKRKIPFIEEEDEEIREEVLFSPRKTRNFLSKNSEKKLKKNVEISLKKRENNVELSPKFEKTLEFPQKTNGDLKKPHEIEFSLKTPFEKNVDSLKTQLEKKVDLSKKSISKKPPVFSMKKLAENPPEKNLDFSSKKPIEKVSEELDLSKSLSKKQYSQHEQELYIEKINKKKQQQQKARFLSEIPTESLNINNINNIQNNFSINNNQNFFNFPTNLPENSEIKTIVLTNFLQNSNFINKNCEKTEFSVINDQFSQLARLVVKENMENLIESEEIDKNEEKAMLTSNEIKQVSSFSMIFHDFFSILAQRTEGNSHYLREIATNDYLSNGKNKGTN